VILKAFNFIIKQNENYEIDFLNLNLNGNPISRDEDGNRNFHYLLAPDSSHFFIDLGLKLCYESQLIY
jgi:hypothetical protein